MSLPPRTSSGKCSMQKLYHKANCINRLFPIMPCFSRVDCKTDAQLNSSNHTPSALYLNSSVCRPKDRLERSDCPSWGLCEQHREQTETSSCQTDRLMCDGLSVRQSKTKHRIDCCLHGRQTHKELFPLYEPESFLRELVLLSGYCCSR